MSTKEAVMTTKEIANRLVELCRSCLYEEAQNELFSEDAESIEPPNSPGMQSVRGLDAIRQKGQAFQAMVETIHGGYVTDPVIEGRFIALGLGIDATMKGMDRSEMHEVAVYETKDGKIIKEQFFY